MKKFVFLELYFYETFVGKYSFSVNSKFEGFNYPFAVHPNPATD